MQFERTGIKKEFIIKKLTKDPLDDDFLGEQAEKIRQYIANNIEEDFSAWDRLQMVTLFKDKENRFHKRAHGDTNSTITSTQGDSSITDMGKQDIIATYQFIIDKMGFPKERQIDNQEFVRGTFYQALD